MVSELDSESCVKGYYCVAVYSWERQFSFTVPLSTQMYKWEPVSSASCPGKEKKLEALEP